MDIPPPAVRQGDPLHEPLRAEAAASHPAPSGYAGEFQWLNRGGVCVGTAEFYAVVEDLPEVAEALVIDTGGPGCDGVSLLFVVARPGAEVDDRLRAAINARLRAHVSPRHVPDAIYAVPELPRTLDGKKLEVPVTRILTGAPLEKAIGGEAVANPGSLRFFVDLFNNL